MDLDGNQDIYAVMGGAYEGDVFRNLLFENPIGNSNNWININLKGSTSNRSAIGAKIVLTLDENELGRKIYHTVGTGASFGGNSLMAEIGLGQTNNIKSLEIYWPNKEKTNSLFKDVKINQLITITEGNDTIEVLNLKTTPFKAVENHMHHQ